MSLKTIATLVLTTQLLGTLIAAQEESPVTFNTNFEGASLGKIEKLDDNKFRCHVAGQYDERGRNRQATWYFFRMDAVKGREVTLTLSDLVGEYNDKSGTAAMSSDIIPVFSYDSERWQHFAAMDWDDQKKEATLKFRAERDTIWIAHIPPYTTSRLQRLLAEINRHPHVLVEIVGKTVQGRDLSLVKVTNPHVPDSQKKNVWLIARQHAWEAGTSFVMEGALRFVTSDDASAVELRDRVIFNFVPMMDPDGCVGGKVRFNANGYDVNRHWDEVDLRSKTLLERMPEIWCVKKAIFGWLNSGRGIDLMLNLHNTESTEYLQTLAEDESALKKMERLYERLAMETSFDPSRKFSVSSNPDSTTNSLWKERRIPVLLMEQRIGFSSKLGRRPTVEDRLTFGRKLIATMAETVVENPGGKP
ncbi:MAG: hypothetical protein EXS31_06675 [Pedosphaera sp.]|nr:hypothetical protein [Pedosphaera sp.]